MLNCEEVGFLMLPGSVVFNMHMVRDAIHPFGLERHSLSLQRIFHCSTCLLDFICHLTVICTFAMCKYNAKSLDWIPAFHQKGCMVYTLLLPVIVTKLHTHPVIPAAGVITENISPTTALISWETLTIHEVYKNPFL